MKKIMNRLFWYLARKLGYSVGLQMDKHFYYTGIYAYMPDEIIVYFAYP